jgi:glycosyltransferase involved in cell wall biosynthesis
MKKLILLLVLIGILGVATYLLIIHRLKKDVPVTDTQTVETNQNTLSFDAVSKSVAGDKFSLSYPKSWYLQEDLKYLKAFNLFVLPSKYEGMPMTVLEAKAAGIKILASDVGGNREILDEDQIYRLDDKNDFIDKV